MRIVSVLIETTLHSAFISDEIYTLLLDGARLRGRPIEFYLFSVVKLYGSLTRENINKYMDGYWIF